MEQYLTVLRKYADFNGRSRRKEFWMFQLFNIIILFTISIILGIFLDLIGNGAGVISMILFFAYAVAVVVPSIAVTIRRLHDINKSGWYYFVSFIPFIGSIILLIWLCTEGTLGPNQYGADPKRPYDDISEIGQKDFV